MNLDLSSYILFIKHVRIKSRIIPQTGSYIKSINGFEISGKYLFWDDNLKKVIKNGTCSILEEGPKFDWKQNSEYLKYAIKNFIRKIIKQEPF